MITTIIPLIGRRLLMSIVILLIVSALLFVVLHVLPVDPAAMSMPPTGEKIITGCLRVPSQTTPA